MVMAYPKPDDDIFLKYASCSIPFTYANGINRLLLTDTLEIEAMSMRVDLP